MIPKELIEEIRAQNDIVDVVSAYVPLKQKGSSYFGLCPFHHEKSPSFSVDGQKQFYYCFGCGEAGNVYSFLMKMENCDFVEAVERLAERVHIALPSPESSPRQLEMSRLKQRLLTIHKTAGLFYYNMLHTDEGKEALSYLTNRQIEPGIQKKFGLGYAPNNRQMLLKHLREQGFSNEEMLQSGLIMESRDEPKGMYDRFYNRLMFPIMDVSGQVIGFGGRIIGKGEPKYLNSPETILFNKSHNLFGLNLARAAKKKEIILVEGYMDMITLYQAGFKNTVAALGTAFNQEHARTLKKYANAVILLYDSDEAGTKAALRAIPVLVENSFEVKVLQVSSGKDPDDFVRENGANEFSKLLATASHYISFQIACIKENFNMDKPQDKVKFTTESADILARLESDIERSVYIKEVAAMTGIAPEAIESEIAKLRKSGEEKFLKEANAKRQEQYQNVKNTIASSKGLLDAQKDVLYLCAMQSEVYKKLSAVLSPDDFSQPVYKEMFRLLGKIHSKNQAVIPAALISQFETVEEQKTATEIFAVKLPYANTIDWEKGFNEEWKHIKKINIDKRAQEAVSVNEVKELLESKRKLDTLYITIADG